MSPFTDSNVSTAAMSPDEQETYIERLGKLGYCWQFITLAGLHTTALASRKMPLLTTL